MGSAGPGLGGGGRAGLAAAGVPGHSVLRTAQDPGSPLGSPTVTGSDAAFRRAAEAWAAEQRSTWGEPRSGTVGSGTVCQGLRGGGQGGKGRDRSDRPEQSLQRREGVRASRCLAPRSFRASWRSGSQPPSAQVLGADLLRGVSPSPGASWGLREGSRWLRGPQFAGLAGRSAPRPLALQVSRQVGLGCRSHLRPSAGLSGRWPGSRTVVRTQPLPASR